MALGNIPDYAEGNNGVEWYRDAEGGVYVRIYDDGATAYSNGVVYALTFTSASSVIYADVTAPTAIATASTIVGVINNAPKGLDTIAAYGKGWLQIAGYCPYVNTTGTIAANAQMEVQADAPTVLQDDTAANGGVQTTPNCVGVAIAEITTNVWSVFLVGKPVVVAA
jgi:hypothetical protein